MLTLREKNTLDFIKGFIDDKGYAPTIMEIANAIGIKSRGVAHRYVTSLTQKGLLRNVPNRRRNIELTDSRVARKHALPIVGKIAAGQPIEAITQFETLDMHDILREEHFALRVRGDSMVDEGILDGDIVICDNTVQPSNGQIVVALIDNSDVTLKRIEFNTDRSITLHPANERLQPITYEASRVAIQGKLVSLIRLPRSV